MFKRVRFVAVTCLLLAPGLDRALAQVKSVPLPDTMNARSIIVIFPSNVTRMDGTDISGGVVAPSVYIKEAGQRIYLTCSARALGSPRQIELSNFRTLAGNHAVNLINGSDDGGVIVPPVAAGAARTYFITWESVQLETQGQPAPTLTVAKVGSSADNSPVISANLLPNEREFALGTQGILPRDLLAKFNGDPGKIKVLYEFDPKDFGPPLKGNVTSLRGEPTGSAAPHSLIIGIKPEPPHRAEPYTVKLEFPAADVRDILQPGYAIPATDAVVIVAKELALAPPPTERAKTEFFFEGTFTSIVDAKTRKRANVGLFGLHIKPTLPVLTHNVFDRGTSPWWTAIRPLFDADVDTRPIKDSQAPNRVVFGMDLELGRDTGIGNANAFLQQLVWLNGARYDSDRDFKLQTAYWQTEIVPYFRNFEQTREQRLRQFRYPNGIKSPEKGRLSPVISSYYIRPSVGYQLGGISKRDFRVTSFPTDTISRLFVKLSMGVELKRLFALGFDDTYYLLENAPRRRNRDYFEGRLDFNTGALFNANLAGLQSAITLKFQRGNLPPSFKPVNSLSLGVKLYK
jgi:hypothetical protein